MSASYTITVDDLHHAMRELVRGFGSHDAEVNAVCDNLIEANLMGHDSHGIGMLPRYANAYLEGSLKPNTHLKVLHDVGALLRLDGQAGFGQVIGAEAMDLGIKRARTHGSCIVALGNSAPPRPHRRLGRAGRRGGTGLDALRQRDLAAPSSRRMAAATRASAPTPSPPASP